MITDNENSLFPEETSNGEIHIQGNKIVCSGKQIPYDCEVNIDDIIYAYVTVNSKKESMLFLFNYRHNYLPTSYTGFRNVYKVISAKLGFNDELFFDNVHTTSVTKKEIWRKLQPASFRIIGDNYSDYDLGFEILSPLKVFITWDTTFEELVLDPNVFFLESPYGQLRLKFKYPIRIGNIVLDNFSTYFTTARRDVPALSFSATCIDNTNTDKSYYQIKERLQKDFNPEYQRLDYERDDQNSFFFNAQEMSIQLIYSFDYDWSYDNGSTTILFKNKREYPELLIDESYESNIEISSFLTIDEPIRALSNYKRNRRVKRRPSKIKSEFPIIWVDSKNSKIGFADQSFSLVFDKEEIKEISLQNVLPAKGSGRAHLSVILKDSSQVTVLMGKCKVFDSYKEKIEALTDWELNIAPEYDDI